MWEEILNVGHFALFGMLSICISAIVRHSPIRDEPWQKRYAISFVITIAVGAVFELAQLAGPRSANIVDFYRDVAGAYAFLTLDWLIFERKQKRRWRTLAVAVVAAIGVSIAATWILLVEIERSVAEWRAFPVVVSPDAHWSPVGYYNATLTRVSHPDAQPGSERDIHLQLQITDDEFAGISRYVLIRDWQPYRTISFSVYAPDAEPERLLRIRLTDRADGHRRDEWLTFDRTLSTGRNDISIAIEPATLDQGGRSFDWSAVSRIFVYESGPKVGTSLVISEIRLTD